MFRTPNTGGSYNKPHGLDKKPYNMAFRYWKIKKTNAIFAA